jgi:Undecaprenyl-phosphate glucose phosphotransferase
MVEHLAILLDGVTVAVAGLLVLYLYSEGARSIPASHWPRYYGAVAIGGLLAMLLLRSFRLHTVGTLERPRFGDHLRLSGAWLMTLGLMLAIAFVAKASDDYSRGWFLLWAAAGVFLLSAERTALGLLLTRRGRRSVVARRIAIVGSGMLAERLVRELQAGSERPEIVGAFDDRIRRRGPDVAGVPVLGTIDELIARAQKTPVDEVIIALPWSAERRILSVRNRLAILPADIRLGPDMVGFAIPHMGITQLGSVPLVDLQSRPLRDWDVVLKAIEDYAVATLALIVLALPMALVALLIRLDSPGPALFRQRRHGFNGDTIDVYKFRTMHHDLGDPTGRIQTVRNDPRITRLGRFLRRSSIDELPQLFNVLEGKMSVVGPRAHALIMRAGERLYHEAVHNYAVRHKVKPGITGWAQVNGWRGETDTIEKAVKRIEYDLYYINNWSIWLDMKILLMTPFALFGRNAY